MREIKFKCWDNANKRFVYNLLYRIDSNGDLPESHTLCQFTGLKDKNGVEIYEGDIAKDNGGFIYKVIWRKKKARFAYKCNEGSKTNMNQKEDAKIIEVIGNIYENPKLLEQK